MHFLRSTIKLAFLALLSSSAPAQPAVADGQVIAQRLEAAATILEEWQATLPPDPRDRKPILAETGPDPKAVAAWVDGHTRYVPYRGMLRGADGVLMDRAGNALDRALLLAALLSDAGHEVRIAHGEIGEAEAAGIIDAPAPAGAASPRLEMTQADALRTALFAQGDLDRSAMTAMQERLDVAQANAKKVYNERFAALADDVVSVAPAGDAAALRAGMIIIARDHFWVQVKAADGWTDLGLAAPAVTETFAPGAVPESLRHRVKIRVVVEMWSDEGRSETTLVEVATDAAATIDRPFSISHGSGGYPSFAEIAASADPMAALQTALAMTGGWVPVIVLGDERTSDKGFSHDGRIGPAENQELTGTRQAIDDSNADAIGALGGDDTRAPATTPTAEFVDFELIVPGEPVRIERRTIFDLAGPARRATETRPAIGEAEAAARGIAASGRLQGLLFPSTPSDAFVARAMARDLASAYRKAASAISGAAELDAASVTPDREFPVAAYAYAAGRPGASTASPRGLQIALLHEGLVPATGGSVTPFTLFDIVNNVVAREDGFAGRVRAGVEDAIAEYLITGAPASGSQNAAAAFAEDREAGREWTKLVPGDDAAALLDLDADSEARIMADLAKGYLVLAPRNAASAGAAWWRIDAATGDTIGVGASGAGASMTDYAMHMTWGLNVICAFQSMRLIGQAISKGIGGNTNGAMIGAGMACAAAAGGVGTVAIGMAGAFGPTTAVGILMGMGVLSGAGAAGSGLID